MYKCYNRLFSLSFAVVGPQTLTKPPQKTREFQNCKAFKKGAFLYRKQATNTINKTSKLNEQENCVA